MYRCERRTLSLQEQEPRSPTDEWCSAAVVMATAEQKEGEEKGGYWGRKENGIKKKEGGRVLLKGHSFAVCRRSFWGHIGSQVGENDERCYFIGTRVSIKPTPFSSWAQASLSVLVLPLKLYLYSCSHVLRLFRGSNPQGWEFIVYRLCFCWGSYPLGSKPTVSSVFLINLFQSHLFPLSDISKHHSQLATNKP